MIIFKSHEALDYITAYLPNNPIILEAGAFDGSDTVRMAQKWPTAIIHAFEPVPEIYAVLVKKTHSYKNIRTYNIALNNKNGTALFYVSEKSNKPGIPSQAGSLLMPKDRFKHSSIQFPYTIEVPTITLDNWANQNKIDRLDFAWLDMQGHELTVLQASPKMLETMRAIYLEIGFYENYENQPTHEQMKQWLNIYNFQEVGRDFENKKKSFFGNSLFIKNKGK